MKRYKKKMKTKQLPKDWKEVELGVLGEIVTGNTPPMKNSENYGGKTPWIKPPNLDKEKYLSASETYLSYTGVKNSRLLPKGSVLVSCIGNIGKVAIAGVELCTNQQINGIVPNKNTLSEFLFFVIKKNQRKIEAKASKAVVPLLNKREFSKVRVLFPFKNNKPDLETQKKIVAILEKAEQLKQKREEAIRLLEDYVKSVFNEMFLGKGFEKFNFEELCFFENGDRGKNYPSDHTKDNVGVPFINAGDFINEKISNSKLNYIREEQYKKLSSGKFKKGDLIFCLRGSIGKFAFNKNISKGAIASSLVIIRPMEKITSEYLIYFLKTPFFQNSIKKYDASSSQPNLSAKNVKSFKVPLPPLPLQQKFASIVEHVEKLKEKQMKSKEELDNLFNALMQKAFKGELVG